MGKIKLLDCTLRDGGYVNDWKFDFFNMHRIIKSLKNANIDIIECGYLKDSYNRQGDGTIFNSIEGIEVQLKGFDRSSTYVAMINQGEVDVTKLPSVSIDSKITGIRIVFRKNQIEEAFNNAKILMQKGYKVFVQAMVTLSYTDKELLNLIEKCNETNIFALYMVDSFGAMNGKDIKRLSYIINHNLKCDIMVGFHAHNNLQLAYPNSIEFIKCFQDRDIIIDSSIFGMGRGAGNLPTELITAYLNDNHKSQYDVEPILDITDKYINRIHSESYWGYSISYYLSGVCNCHPNYASFLVNKNTLTITNIQNILSDIKDDERMEFNKEYIQDLYINFNSKKISNFNELSEFKKEIVSKDIFLIAPGKSLLDNIDRINCLDKKKTVVVSVNHAIETIRSDYYFFSNRKRYEEYLEKVDDNMYNENLKRNFIITSNVQSKNNDDVIVSYDELLGEVEGAKDNSMIMMLNLLNKLNINNVFIIGFDGYSNQDSYADSNMKFKFENVDREERNLSILQSVKQLKKKMDLYFITESIFNK